MNPPPPLFHAEPTYPLPAMRRFFSALLLCLVGTTTVATAQVPSEDLPLYYTIRRQATVYTAPDSGRAYVHLRFREPVYLVKMEGAWSLIRTQDGAQGYVSASALSNVWIRVSKTHKSVYVYRGTQLVKKVPADFGYNAFADKERRGSNINPDDWRTPEGVFFVANKNARSTFYKAFVLNYPTAEDAERGRQEGIITEAEYAAIVKAEQDFAMPPMHTALGGWIEIHGNGTGVSSNWTQGCVAIRNVHIDEIWDIVDVGTPVLIEN